MANLIRLKQIESGSALQTSAEIGSDFSQSVINIVTTNVEAVLPEGVISSSAQVELVSASGYTELATDIEVAVVSSSVSASIAVLSQTYVTTASLNELSSSFVSSVNIISESIDSRVYALEQFSSSLDQTFATDLELSASQSTINVDMGEF